MVRNCRRGRVPECRNQAGQGRSALVRPTLPIKPVHRIRPATIGQTDDTLSRKVQTVSSVPHHRPPVASLPAGRDAASPGPVVGTRQFLLRRDWRIPPRWRISGDRDPPRSGLRLISPYTLARMRPSEGEAPGDEEFKPCPVRPTTSRLRFAQAGRDAASPGPGSEPTNPSFVGVGGFLPVENLGGS